MSSLHGWRNCTTDNCGRNFVSAYSTLVFVQVDDERVNPSPAVTLAPGRHWVEAHYSWGVGVMVGIGNYRNYGFELNVLPDHHYTIKDVPSGCIVPASRYWVSPKPLRVESRGPGGDVQVQEVRAMEYCAPNDNGPGTCKTGSDCSSGVCTGFQGTTGHGLCGVLRE